MDVVYGERLVLGYEATRYAATEAFAKSWRPGEKGTVQVLGHPAGSPGYFGVPGSLGAQLRPSDRPLLAMQTTCAQMTREREQP